MRVTKKILNQKLVKELKNKTVLVTGGAGSLGSELSKKLLDYPIKTLRVLDINEHSLFKLNRQIKDKRLRLLLGDVLDNERIIMAGKNVDIIIHTAAVKNIEITEFNPIQTVNVNINGTVNLIEMAMLNKPKKILNISTDKAADPSTLYGSTKQIGEKLITWAGSHLQPIKFGTIRFGNIIESRGNVFETWEEENTNKKPLSITDKNMKRYFIHIDEVSEFILSCILQISSGEIFIPKMKSYRIVDLANKISKKHKIIGLREGEKMEEMLMTEQEREKAKETKNMWIIKNSELSNNYYE
jgi:UDP-N-acetylglucosamine 4,6-dehydratase/5-epimerase